MKNKEVILSKYLPKVYPINPNLAEAHSNLGIAYFNQGQRDLSIGSYEKAIDIDPTNALSHYNLGIAYYQQGKYDLAIESLTTAISINPKLDSLELREFITSQQTREVRELMLMLDM